jgi:hypothetical protein
VIKNLGQKLHFHLAAATFFKGAIQPSWRNAHIDLALINCGAMVFHRDNTFAGGERRQDFAAKKIQPYSTWILKHECPC